MHSLCGAGTEISYGATRRCVRRSLSSASYWYLPAHALGDARWVSSAIVLCACYALSRTD
eukprot:2983802-Rhodomonas_salina.2